MRSTARLFFIMPALLRSSSCCEHVAAFTPNHASVHSLTHIPASPRRMHSCPYGRTVAANFMETIRGTSLCSSSASNSNNDIDESSSPDEPCNGLTEEMERLQQKLTYIEALEERNKAQLDSFVDEQDQWDSMEEEERQLLQSKGDIEKRLEQMTSELVNMWIGGKSMEG